MNGVKKEEVEKALETIGIQLNMLTRALAHITTATKNATLDVKILNIELNKLKGEKNDDSVNS